MSNRGVFLYFTDIRNHNKNNVFTLKNNIILNLIDEHPHTLNLEHKLVLISFRKSYKKALALFTITKLRFVEKRIPSYSFQKF